MLSLLSLLTLSSSIVSAAPFKREQADATFTLDEATLAAGVDCSPSGAPNGIVLLMHGTGLNASVWDVTPYPKELPGMGYDVCRIDQPGASMMDAQLTGEYIAYAIKTYAPQSATGQMAIFGHSQGAANPQWALAFWPSLRPLVSAYVAFGADYRGTDLGPLMCAVADLNGSGCVPAVAQQTSGSNYANALYAIDQGAALVPTTSIRTSWDEVVSPVDVSGVRSGPLASNIKIQDMCTSAYVVDHMALIVDGPSKAIAYDALANGGLADISRISKLKACTDLSGYADALKWLKNAFQATINIEFKNYPFKVHQEPALAPYVCTAGAATQCGN